MNLNGLARRTLAIGFLFSTLACTEGSPTAPTGRSVESYSLGLSSPVRFGIGQVPPDYQGTWVGQHQLIGCRTVSACKVFPGPQAIRLDLLQEGTQLTGIIEIFGSRRVFEGFVSEGPGIAGTVGPRLTGEESNWIPSVSIFLMQAEMALIGTIVDDNFAQSRLQSSIRFDIVTPLQRIQ